MKIEYARKMPYNMRQKTGWGLLTKESGNCAEPKATITKNA